MIIKQCEQVRQRYFQLDRHCVWVFVPSVLQSVVGIRFSYCVVCFPVFVNQMILSFVKSYQNGDLKWSAGAYRDACGSFGVRRLFRLGSQVRVENVGSTFPTGHPKWHQK